MLRWNLTNPRSSNWSRDWCDWLKFQRSVNNAENNVYRIGSRLKKGKLFHSEYFGTNNSCPSLWLVMVFVMNLRSYFLRKSTICGWNTIFWVLRTFCLDQGSFEARTCQMPRTHLTFCFVLFEARLNFWFDKNILSR